MEEKKHLNPEKPVFYKAFRKERAAHARRVWIKGSGALPGKQHFEIRKNGAKMHCLPHDSIFSKNRRRFMLQAFSEANHKKQEIFDDTFIGAIVSS